MADDDDEDHHHHQQQQPSTPFWLKDTAFRTSGKISLATLSSIMFSSGSVILLLVIAAAMIFVFFFVPSIMNLISQIFRPNSVKRSWDSLNLVLILFAIICAFLSRVNSSNETPKSASSCRFRSPYKEPEQGYDIDISNRMTTRLRSSSSYPDLRHQLDYTSIPIAPWSSHDYIDCIRSNRIRNVAYRFSDDTQLRSYQFTDSSWNISSKPATEFENSNPAEAAKQVPSPPQQPPTQTSTRVNHKSTRTYRTVERTEESLTEPNPNQLLPLQSPTRAYTVRRKTKRANRSFDDAAFDTRDEEQMQNPTYPYTAESVLSERKKSGGATKDFLSSFYGNQKRKKKRERQRSSESFEQLLKQPLVHSSSTTTTPPPPPPPPPSVFQNIFSTKKSKNKKTASDPSDSISYTTKIALAQIQIPTPSTISTSHNVLTGNESPLYGIPEPPPLPPFGMPVWKFVVEGDYVRLKSMNSSRSGSPGLEDDSIRASSLTGESMWSEMDDDDEIEGESPVSTPASKTAAFWPSPDVNTKADNFIARFRAGLKMEKVNSGKGVGLSRLGPVANVNDHD